jgi:hypothetical protein
LVKWSFSGRFLCLRQSRTKKIIANKKVINGAMKAYTAQPSPHEVKLCINIKNGMISKINNENSEVKPNRRLTKGAKVRIANIIQGIDVLCIFINI